MNICCDEYTDLGCLNSCNEVNLGIAGFTGDYTLLLSSGLEVTQAFTALDELLFDVTLNEDNVYTASLTHPNATTTCFKFKTYYTIVR